MCRRYAGIDPDGSSHIDLPGTGSESLADGSGRRGRSRGMHDRENTRWFAHGRKRRAHAYALVGTLLALALTMLLGACSGTSTLQSVALLKAAQDKFNAAKSFHFVMQADNLGTAPQDVINVKNAEGDVQRPDKLSATGYITLNGL